MILKLVTDAFEKVSNVPVNVLQAISIAQFCGQSFAVVLLTLEVVLKFVWVRFPALSTCRQVLLQITNWKIHYHCRPKNLCIADGQALSLVQSQPMVECRLWGGVLHRYTGML